MSSFSSQLIHFTRKTLSLEEVETILPRLFIQSPKLVLKTVIEEALMKGFEGMHLIQGLKYVPIVCSYQSSEEDIPPLIEELEHYILKAKLKASELKNMRLLIKHLMEVQAQKHILSFDLFLRKCIIPNFSSKSNERVMFNFQCLNVALDVLFQKDALQMDQESFVLLIKHVGQIISFCMESGNGKLKEIAVMTLSLLNNCQKTVVELDDATKYSLWTFFSSYNPAVSLYTIEFLPRQSDMIDTPVHICELLWTWCCITKNTNLFEKQINNSAISYVRLLNILTPLLYHFTKEEWLDSVSLIKVYCSCVALKDVVCSNTYWVLDQNNYPYNVIRCFMDCLQFILKDEEIADIPYLANCFASTTMSILIAEEQNPRMLTNVFLDVCFMLSGVSADKIVFFAPLLMDLKKRVLACAESFRKEYLTLLLLGVKHLPESDAKDSLSQGSNLLQGFFIARCKASA